MSTPGIITDTISSNIGVGFGTAALGDANHEVVLLALEAGFRKFDTAEADYWYRQGEVGKALETYFYQGRAHAQDDECVAEECSRTCASEGLLISTKIPPWSLTSEDNIRQNAKESREELVGFCEDEVLADEHGNIVAARPYPLDVYYIHGKT